METVQVHSRRVRRRTFVLALVEARIRQTQTPERHQSLRARRTKLLTQLEREAQLPTVPPGIRRAVVDVLDAYERLLEARTSSAKAKTQYAYTSALTDLAGTVRSPSSERALATVAVRRARFARA